MDSNKVKKNPLVYIIMPCYNAEKYLLEQLLSIYNQNYTNRYLIFINDGSTDSSEKIILDFIKEYNLYNKIKIIKKKNWWVNSAVNQWFLRIKDNYSHILDNSFIAFCDCDDIWTRDKLAIQVKYMIDNPDCWLSYHDLVIIDEYGIFKKWNYLWNIYHENISFFYLATIWNFLTSTAMMFRTKYIDLIYPFPIWKCLYQDERVAYVLSLNDIQIKFINIQLWYYRIWHNSLLKQSREKYKKEYNINKHENFLQLKKRFPEKDLSYIINYRYDRFIKWNEQYWMFSIKVYFLILFRYTKIFFLLMKLNTYKLFWLFRVGN